MFHTKKRNKGIKANFSRSIIERFDNFSPILYELSYWITPKDEMLKTWKFTYWLYTAWFCNNIVTQIQIFQR